jgi:cation/acetate symporter
MSFSTRARLVNPRLGTYFSIFAALFVAIFLLSLISEQLQVSSGALRWVMFAGPLVLYVLIGFSTAVGDPLGYFAAGRRVPAGYTGLILAISSIGATLLIAGTGAFYFAGFDALVLMIGGLSGFVFMAMMLAPFYRKFGAYTVPSYLGRRFESKGLRLAAAMVAAVPMLLVLAAELNAGATVAGRLTGHSHQLMVLVLALTVAATVAPGGKRGFTWAAVAQAIGVIIALFVCAATVAVIETSLPVPQLTHGPLVRNLVRNEVAQGLQLVWASPLAFDFPGEGLRQITKPYTAPFGATGAVAFVLGSLMMATGIAAAPWLLPRVAATPGVYEARKSLGWATVFFGLTMLTMSAVAVFMRGAVLDLVMNQPVGALPKWVSDLATFGFGTVDRSSAKLTFEAIRIDRDAVLFALPLVSGLPNVFVYFIFAGAIAAAVAGAGATTVSLAAVLSEDVVQGLTWEPTSGESRVWIARGFAVISALSGAFLTLSAPTDSLRLVFWALGLTSASLFPVMVLSIWWKRLTRAGALAGMTGGFGAAALAIFASEAGVLPLSSSIAGVLGFPVATILALTVSTFVREMSRHDLEVVRDIRVPGGEIIYDREMRRLQLKKRSRP